MEKTAEEEDWQAYLQSHSIDVPEFWRYAKTNQVWSFVREGQAVHQGEYLTRFVRILGMNPDIDQVHGVFAFSLEEAMDGKAPAEGQPTADQWANIKFIQSYRQPVEYGTEPE